MSDFRHRLTAIRRAMFNRSTTERDLDDEIRLHLDLETEKNVQAGHSSGEARRLALIAFGGVELAKEAHRDGRMVRTLQDLSADARYAVRTLRRSPVFAVAAIVTLGLGIGATTAIYSVVNSVILRPLPFNAPNQLVMLWEENPDRDWKLQTAAPANFLDWRDGVKSFQSMAAMMDFWPNVTLTGNGEPIQLSTGNVTGSFFSTLGVQPQLGRSFREEETWRGNAPVAMLSYRVWQNYFGKQDSVIGRNVQLNGRSYQVVGVLPQSFRFPGADPDIWLPTAFPLENRTRASFRRAHYLRVVARLRDGVTSQVANAELQAVVKRLQLQYPGTNTHMGAGFTPLHEFLVGSTRRPLLLLSSAVGVLLLIACANVGNLLLVQAGARQREVAMRLALGASRLRLVRQALTESVVLSVLGGVAGLAFGWMAMRALASIQPPGLLPAGAIAPHTSEVLFVLLTSLSCGVLFGVAPAFWSSRRVANDALKVGARSGSASARLVRLGGALVVAEVAMAALLTVGAGLLMRSYWGLDHTDAGFNDTGVMTMGISLPAVRYDSTEKMTRFYDQLVARSRVVPGVQGAAVVSSLPATLYSWSSDFSIAGRAPDAFGTEVVHREATAEYQQVMGVRLIAGRFLTDADREGAPKVVLINEALARKYFAGENPVGQRVSFDRQPDSTSTWRTIVGVVGSERQANLANASRAEFIAPYAQEPRSSMTLVVRAASTPLSIAPTLRRILSELDHNLAPSAMLSMSDVRAESLSRDRFLTIILLAFAGVGLALAVVGVYGVMAQTARIRTREMGIRIALGAPTRGVQWLIVRFGLRLAVLGLILGVFVAMLTTRGLASLLYETAPLDPVTFVSVPIVLLIAAVSVSWLPAWRASRVDPAVTLRSD